MMQQRKRKQTQGFVFLFVIVAAISLVIGTDPLTDLATAGPASAQELIVALPEDVVNLDPARLTSTEDQIIAFNLYSGLVKFKTGSVSEVEPDLATRWSLSPDGRVYTFELRRNVRWHKNLGVFTAADVKYSFDRIMDARTGSPYRANFALVDRIETDGDYTVRIQLRQPFPSFLTAVLAFRPGLIVSRQAIEGKGDTYVNNPIGTGPFQFQERLPGERVVLVPNSSYFGSKPKLQRVTFKRVSQDALAEIALRSGQINLAYFQDSEVQRRAMRQSTLKVESGPAAWSNFLYIHTLKKPLDDPRVRLAIAHAVDRASIVDHVLRGLGKPANSLLNPYVLGYPSEEYPHKLNLERAKQLMAQAGVREARLTLVSYLREDVASVLKENLKAIGIDVTLQVYNEWPLTLEQLRSERHDLYIGALGRIDPDQYYTILHSQARPYPNASHVTKYDRLIESARVEVDDAKRRQLYLDIHKAVVEDVPLVPLWYPIRVLATRPDVHNAKLGPAYTLNLPEISIGGR